MYAKLSQPSPYEIAVVIVPGFSSLSLGGIMEPLSYLKANYSEFSMRVTEYGLGGHLVRSEAGITVMCSVETEDLRTRLLSLNRPRAVFFCCGMRVPQEHRDSLRQLLRICDRYNVHVFGLGSAAWFMADTGILSGKKGTVHWKHQAVFDECYFDVDIQNCLFVTKGKSSTCAGETATLDMMIDFIREEFSPSAAEDVCNHLLISYPRKSNTEQPGSIESRFRHLPPSVQRIVRHMSSNIEDPLSMDELSKKVDISVRQIERTFSKNLSTSPRRYYSKLQLEVARQLVEHSEMPIIEIALACGIKCTSRLAKLYKQEFGCTPKSARSMFTELAISDNNPTFMRCPLSP